MSSPEAKLNLSKEQIADIQTKLIAKLTRYIELRDPFDKDIRDDLDLYNNIDVTQDSYDSWIPKRKMPYIYTVCQTAVGRVIKSLFGRDNYVRCYTEGMGYSNESEKAFSQFIQDEMEIVGLRSRARDFIEESAVKRTSWLQLRPRKGIRAKGEGVWAMDFDILDWFSVWFDTAARTTAETDFFIRKLKRINNIIENKAGVYFNTEKVMDTTFPDTDNQDKDYTSKHSGASTIQYTWDTTSDQRPIELIEYYGEWDIGTEEVPDWQEVIFTLANRQLLIRAEKNTLDTRKKRMIFPVRVYRQPNTLIGKSIVQLIRDEQIQLNELLSLRAHNAQLQAGLLFKYKKGANVDWAEMFAGKGNAIGWDDDPRDIDIFQIPNLLGGLSMMIQDCMSSMQTITGAVDYIMGTNNTRGGSETATTSRIMTEQALFKFGMMVDNISDDICEFMLYASIIKLLYDGASVQLQYRGLEPFATLPATLLEENRYFDIAIVDLSQRRDQERSQFINAANIIGNLLEKSGGNVPAFLKEVLAKLQIDGADEILKPNPEMAQAQAILKSVQQNPALGQALQAMIQNPAIAQQIVTMTAGAGASPATGAGGAQGAVVQPSQQTAESAAAPQNQANV